MQQRTAGQRIQSVHLHRIHPSCRAAAALDIYKYLTGAYSLHRSNQQYKKQDSNKHRISCTFNSRPTTDDDELHGDGGGLRRRQDVVAGGGREERGGSKEGDPQGQA